MSKCQYIEVCPAATGWCNNSEPTKECLGMVMRWYRRLKEQREDFVVRVNITLSKDELRSFEDHIRKQVGSGVIVLPHWCTVEYAPHDLEVEFSHKRQEEEQNGE